MQLKLKLNKKFLNTGLILTLLFVVLILGEAYLAYTKIYSNLNVPEGEVSTSNVVRVNLSQYGDAVKLLNQYDSYDPGPNQLQKNPFK